MSTVWNVGAVVGIVIVIALVALSVHAQLNGNFCDWPTWTTPYIQSTAMGLCK